jgi:predicted Zn-dependent protease
LADETLRRLEPLDNPSAQEYVDKLARRIASELPGGYEFQISLVSERFDAVEPIAYPGGYIIVPAGMILQARDEAEFTGLVAHAMAHIAARQVITSGATILLVFVGGQPVLPAGSLPQARAFELEADRSAIIAMARAGIDPRGLQELVERIPERLGRAFSGFPARDERLSAIHSVIDSLPAREYEVTSSRFEAIQTALRRAGIK